MWLFVLGPQGSGLQGSFGFMSSRVNWMDYCWCKLIRMMITISAIF